MRLTGSRAYVRPTPVPKMPPGLVELMEDMTRDVLKNNPPDVYEFCAEHMRKLLEIRDGPTLKQPLTLEQKIARAQEKVRKRGDARWQKYLKQKGKEIGHYKTNLENEVKIGNENTNMQQFSPTVPPSLKSPIYPDLNTQKESEIEISHQLGNVQDLPADIIQMDTNNIEMDNKNDTSVNVERKEELITNKETVVNLGIANSIEDKQTTIVITKDTDNPKANLHENHYDSFKEVIPNIKNMIGNIASIVEVTTIKSEIEEHQIPSAERPKCEEKENNEAQSNLPENPDGSKKEEVLVKQDSGILESTPTPDNPSDFKINIDTLEPATESNFNNSLTDMGTLINTAVGIHNILSETSRSPSRNAENIDAIKDDMEREKDEDEDDVQKADLPTETLSLNDKEQFSSTIFKENDSTVNILETEKKESSAIQNINNVKNPNNVRQHIASEKSSDHDQNTKDDKGVIENEKEQLNIFVGEDSDTNLNHQKKNELENTSHLSKEDVSSSGNHNLEPPIIHDNDVIKRNTENEHAFPGSHEENESFKEPVIIKSADTLAASNDFQSHGEEPSANILDIHETRNTQEPNDGNVIEIRISQVAEALNNEVPLINEDNVKIVEEAELCLEPSKENELIAKMNVIQTADRDEGHLLQSSESDDNTLSSITLVDKTDEAYNVKTSDTINSTNINENRDGLDRISLLESGTFETMNDVIQHSPNNNSMDLETAAVTIQKVFRSFLFKSRHSTFDDNEDNISLEEDNEKKVSTANQNKERRGISRMDTVLQTVNEEKSLSLSTDDSSTLSSAATTIQAHVRGFLLRNKLHSHKTASCNSMVNSDGQSLDGDVDHKNKTILNIHIVPEGGNYLSRDESMLTSMELSLDGSPPSSLNLHPLGYDKNERRKRLKREDAIQSISPPSNNSGKLSEDVDSVKDMLITEGELQTDKQDIKDDEAKGEIILNRPGSGDTSPTNSLTIETVIEAHPVYQESSDADPETPKKTKGILTKQSSDEMDVVTPFEDKNSLADSRSTSKLLHSGEFHDIVLPTKVSRSDASVVSEFKNVLVYFLLWNNS